jgi:hypothetical protein
MTDREPTPADVVLVAIDISKLRNDVLIERPEAQRAIHARKVEVERGPVANLAICSLGVETGASMAG